MKTFQKSVSNSQKYPDRITLTAHNRDTTQNKVGKKNEYFRYKGRILREGGVKVIENGYF